MTFPDRTEVEKLAKLGNKVLMLEPKHQKHLKNIETQILDIATDGSCDFTYKLHDQTFSHQDAYDLQYFLLNQGYYCDYNENERSLFISWR